MKNALDLSALQPAAIITSLELPVLESTVLSWLAASRTARIFSDNETCSEPGIRVVLLENDNVAGEAFFTVEMVRTLYPHLGPVTPDDDTQCYTVDGLPVEPLWCDHVCSWALDRAMSIQLALSYAISGHGATTFSLWFDDQSELPYPPDYMTPYLVSCHSLYQPPAPQPGFGEMYVVRDRPMEPIAVVQSH